MNSNRLLVMFVISLFVGSNSFVQLCLAKSDMQQDVQERIEQLVSSVQTPENEERIKGWAKKYYQELWPVYLATERNIGIKEMLLALKFLALKDFQQSMQIEELQKKDIEVYMKQVSIAKNTELERYFRVCSDRSKDPKNKVFEHFKDEDCSKIFKRYAELMNEDNSFYEKVKKEQAEFMEQILKQQKKKKQYEDSTEEDEE